MKKRLLLFLTAAVLLAPLPRLSAAPFRVYLAAKIPDTWRLAAFADDTLFRGVPFSGPFELYPAKRNAKGTAETRFQAAYNQNGLFFKISCAEPEWKKIDFTPLQTARDQASVVWGKPVIELFLDPAFSRKFAAHTACNTNTALFDRLTGDAGWNYPVHCAVRPEKDREGYAFYIAYPWKDVGSENPDQFAYLFSMTPQNNPVIGFNIARQQGMGSAELTQWVPTTLGFLKPDEFGALVFSGESGAQEKMLALFQAELLMRGVEFQGVPLPENLLIRLTERVFARCEKSLNSLPKAKQETYRKRLNALKLEYSTKKRTTKEVSAVLSASARLLGETESLAFQTLSEEIFKEL